MNNPHSSKGYTLIELLVITVAIGLLAAVALPTWNGFINRIKIKTARSVIYNALSEGKSNAKLKAVDFTVSFKLRSHGFDFCIHPTSQDCTNWQHYEHATIKRCTFGSREDYFASPTSVTGDMCSFKWSWTGTAEGRLGGVYFSERPDGSNCSGVWVQTLLGTMTNRETPKGDNRCLNPEL